MFEIPCLHFLSRILSVKPLKLKVKVEADNSVIMEVTRGQTRDERKRERERVKALRKSIALHFSNSQR
jgi:hypothetical protein